MEAETGRVALAEDVFPAGGEMDLRDAVQDLVEEMHKRHGVAARAFAIVDAAHVRDVRLVGLVQVDAIPAGLEVDLRSEPVLAARLRQVRRLLLGRLVKTGEADAVGDGAAAGGGGEGLGVEGAGVLVTGEHSEAWGEGLDVGAVGASAEVVDGHAVGGDFLEGAVGVLVVE